MLASWEEQQRKLGLLTARQIERDLRWDGRANTDSAYDHDLVQVYRVAHPASGPRSEGQGSASGRAAQQP
jgi:hypothetical protein